MSSRPLSLSKSSNEMMEKILVVGDVHGNYPKLMAALKEAGYSKGDKVYFLGDLMDRGNYNAKVANLLRRMGDDCVVIQGNHEEHHQSLMPYYRTIVSGGPVLCQVTADVFKYSKDGIRLSSLPCHKEAYLKYKCSLEKRDAILQTQTTSLEEAVRKAIVYTMAWEDSRIWEIITRLLSDLCDEPYNASKTMYEYFSATEKTRRAMEAIWNSSIRMIRLQAKTGKWYIDTNTSFDSLVLSHNNPYGLSRISKDPMEGKNATHTNVLHIFGHVPGDEIRMARGTANCCYLNIDISPKRVGVISLIRH